MKQTKLWYVYHIPHPNDPENLNLGYVGISINPYERFKNHTKSKYRVGSAIRKYTILESEVKILNVSSYPEVAYAVEVAYRPEENIGWNLAKGGNGAKSDVYTQRVGNGDPKIRSNKSIFNFWHKEYGIFIGSCYELSQLYSVSSSNLLKVAKEDRNYSKGWMLLKNKDKNFKEITKQKMKNSARTRCEKQPHWGNRTNYANI